MAWETKTAKSVTLSIATSMLTKEQGRRMPQESLTTSTGKQGGFSGGASLIDFITQWNLSQSNDNATADDSSRTLTWQHDSTGARFFHSVCLQTTAGAPRYDKTAILRMVGHFLLSRMPDEGLFESCESLAETYDYYLARTQNRFQPTCSTSRFHYATRGASYVRPSFPLAEKE